MTELVVLLGGHVVGLVEQRRRGDLVFTYERSWQNRGDSYPLSLSMPLSSREHGDDVIRPFMEGLLPDNDTVLKNWARRFQVSPRNPFSLLTHMGEECAGAAQFVRPERVDDVLRRDDTQVSWLTEADVAERLRDLVEAHGTGRLAGDRGHFSLAGAQPKMPLLHDGGRWGIPSGPTPTTHILKPPPQAAFDGFDVNEHFCLRLASELGLAVADSTVRTFEDQKVLVVRRYDRERDVDGRWARLHQEDACQSLAVSPIRKYENEGGPGPVDIAALIVRESDSPGDDLGAFIDALALSWVMGGTDAHAKNYAFLLAPGSVRLAPLYDLISILPYPGRVHYREAKLAMRIDREYHLWKIRRRHWEGLASRCELDPEPLLRRVAELVAEVPQAAARALAAVRDEGLTHSVADLADTEIRSHAERCSRALDTLG